MWRKTLAFLSFQIVQDTSMVREAMARRSGMLELVRLSHQERRESSRCQSVGSRCASPYLSMSIRQSLKVKRHLANRWTLDSCTCLQSGQRPQLSQPHRSSLSVVQMRSCKASQEKNLTFGGAPIFQTMESMEERIKPRNSALYAVDAEYEPSEECFQMMSSSEWMSRCMSWMSSQRVKNSCTCWPVMVMSRLIVSIQAFSVIASRTFQFFLLEASKTRGAMSFGLRPSSQGSPKKAFWPHCPR